MPGVWVRRGHDEHVLPGASAGATGGPCCDGRAGYVVNAGGAVGSLVVGGELVLLDVRDAQLLRLAVRLLASQTACRDGAVPANLLVLQGLFERVAAGAAATGLPTAGRLPHSAVLGSDGSAYGALAGTVGGMEIREVAQVLGCGHRNVRDLVARGALPARKAGGRWLVQPLDLQDLLESRRSA